ncbi:TIGR00730 family Rossman fold protein [Chitinophaga pendula]|uniref:LOG family protein n=1 Tax=Chitinophaga TaxID=79328 RepID=UPI000BB03172|nr:MULTISPECIES: TIGR00730 family Rossman fold protein [Chitinophaga]ASZ10672.1 TIGR00730 family Rossman fold protein [Chitinophaga sp. MD30]UCJ06353.1 TIGR00730 family Rossman fold protein [Chitinophaga pendula]
MKSITVFCGSSSGNDRIYEEQAYLLGKTLATQNIIVVYGGARVGLMGAVANGALEAGGKVIGVLPHFLGSKEIAHTGLTQLIMVDTMHERKTKMHELSDGVIALPGGFGTMEEFFEMLTWAQLGLHKYPVALLNINGFYDGLLQLTDNMTQAGLLKPINRDMMLSADNIPVLLALMEAYKAPNVPKWISSEEKT